MKIITYLICFVSLSSIVNAQQSQTVVFKPGPNISEDILVWSLDDDCILSGSTQTPGNVVDNNGNGPELMLVRWTWGSHGCGEGTTRTYLKFTELASIPTNAIINSATIRLFGIPTSLTGNGGNTTYPGSPTTTTNEAWMRRVTGPWTETTLTFNTQPTNTNAGQINIPSSSSQWNWNWTNNSQNLTNMVQEMVANPSLNNGFVMQLQTEQLYRRMIFASSDHPNSNLWPELEVDYTVPLDTCNTNFTYTFTTEMPGQVVFNAVAIDTNASYEWDISGSSYSGPNMTHTFSGSGLYDVCFMQTSSSQPECPVTCVAVCVGEGLGLKGRSIEHGFETNIAPNPSSTLWNATIKAPRSLEANFTLHDISGKLVLSKFQSLKTGSNNIQIDGTTLSVGLYILTIKSDAGKIISINKLTKG